MTNQDIETFFAVLDHGTMTAAAEALYITQPSLSARLKALEDQVGAPLFHRGKGQRRITLTDAGQHFLPLARRWQNLLSETQTFAAAEKRESDCPCWTSAFPAAFRYQFSPLPGPCSYAGSFHTRGSFR